MVDPLPLSQALAEGRLEDFIAQAEAAGIGCADPAAFDRIIERLIKAPPREGQTSRSPARDGSREK